LSGWIHDSSDAGGGTVLSTGVLDHARPALALLDMRMPDMDGWEFAQALDERCLRLPRLVMTAGTHGRRWAEEIGAVGCVTKPFELKYLVAEVERLAPT